MDVWFDSGSSYFAVMQKREGIKDPADLYLEGSDQHRGWFNSSLCIAVANSGHAPYKQVLTHGFFLDERGDKVSKSRGNAMDPQDIINRLGADVLRLWVASTDYRSDMAISPNIMKQISETYRKIRNTTRYLLGNLYDFDPARDGVAYENMAELDRWALIKLNHLVALAANAYAEYEFHTLYHGVNKFCVTEMSAFYLDVVKDCLYAELPDDARRRSTQTALYQILNALTRILTPVLAFTAEEIYSFMPKDADAPASVQLLNMPIFDDKLFDRALEEKWESVLLLRETVMKELETARQSKIIGHSLDAKVILTLNEEDYKLLSTVDAAKIFIVSQVELKKSAAEKQAPQIKIEEACGKKCLRCWIYSEDIEAGGADPGVCPRCVSVLSRTAEKS
jgi:isoleucyl-tRNA synthetase